MGRETWLEDVLGGRSEGGGPWLPTVSPSYGLRRAWMLRLPKTDGKRRQKPKQRAARLEEGRSFYKRSLGGPAFIDAAV